MDARQDHESTRTAFEDLVGGEPFVRSIERVPSDPEKYAFPGSYLDIDTCLAWQSWKAAIDHATADKTLISNAALTELHRAAVAIATIPQSDAEGTPAVIMDRARDLIQAAEDVLFEPLVSMPNRPKPRWLTVEELDATNDTNAPGVDLSGSIAKARDGMIAESESRRQRDQRATAEFLRQPVLFDTK